ncbi:10846_t:CDS:1, partial [Funneliformis mosseae]
MSSLLIPTTCKRIQGSFATCSISTRITTSCNFSPRMEISRKESSTLKKSLLKRRFRPEDGKYLQYYSNRLGRAD